MLYLANGWWCVSRHVNYLGEILMAVGLTLGAWAIPGVWEVWLYPAFYVVLLFLRERADERRCAAKYGELWTEYERRVPQADHSLAVLSRRAFNLLG